VEAYVQQVMLSQTEARYYAENADGTVSDQPHTAAVTDRKLEYLTKGGELAGLAPDGVLEEWDYYYLVSWMWTRLRWRWWADSIMTTRNTSR